MFFNCSQYNLVLCLFFDQEKQFLLVVLKTQDVTDDKIKMKK